VILGAGAIGCFVGAHWAKAGQAITLIGREKTFDGFRDAGLRLTGGLSVDVSTRALTLTADPASLQEADLIVVSTKSTAIDAVIDDLKTFAKIDTPVISLLNGLDPVRRLRAAFPNRNVLSGMVPFNVVWRAPEHLHRSSAGVLAIERSDVTADLQRSVERSGAPVALHDDIEAVQHGKLLLNLVNPINALSGISLHAMLSKSGYRKIYSAVLGEALGVYRDAGVSFQKVGPIHPALAVRLLRLPDWFFNATLLRLQKIDRNSMTSMAWDLAAGRQTEIEMLNGEILRLARMSGGEAPLNGALVDLVRSATAPMALSYDQLGRRIGL